MFTVLVTGSRDWTDRHTIWVVLNQLKAEHGNSLRVRHGACPSGADAHAAGWCRLGHGLTVVEQARPARWHTDGKAAGFERNARMLTEQPVPDLVTAFPLLCRKRACRFMADGPHWTHGTKDMVEQSEVAGLDVRTFKPRSR